MDALIIENPHVGYTFSMPWEQVRDCILVVVNTFPKEYVLIKPQEGKDQIAIFNPFLNHQSGAIPNDRILYLTNEGIGDTPKESIVKFEVTNQLNKISSYTERDSLQKSMDTFIALLNKSVRGTLKADVAKLNSQKKAATSASGFVSLITLVVAVVAIVMGFKACNM